MRVKGEKVRIFFEIGEGVILKCKWWFFREFVKEIEQN